MSLLPSNPLINYAQQSPHTTFWYEWSRYKQLIGIWHLLLANRTYRTVYPTHSYLHTPTSEDYFTHYSNYQFEFPMAQTSAYQQYMD